MQFLAVLSIKLLIILLILYFDLSLGSGWCWRRRESWRYCSCHLRNEIRGKCM